MALDYGSVKDAYDTLYGAGVTTKTLPEWSQDMNELTGTDLYTAGLHDNWIKRASHGIDKLLESTGLPGYGEQLGRKVGGLIGAPEEGAEVGHGLPRSLVNFAPLLIPGGGVGGAIAKFGLTGALTGAEAYEKTDSPLSALIAAGTATALPGVAGKASEVTSGALGKVISSKLLQRVGGEAAGQVAAAGVVGASQPLEELARGEKPTSPLTVGNLLGLTLGQAPFAAIHLAGRAFRKSPELSADELQKTAAATTEQVQLKNAKAALDEQTPVEKIPDEPVIRTVSPETLKQTQLLLAQVRGEQIDIKSRDDLTDAQKVEEQNKLSQREYELTQKGEVEAGYDTILGNKSQPDAPRQEVLGTQRFVNKTGTYRAIQVSDDPSNPEELRGKVIGYSTKNEPNPVFGFQSQETNIAKYSLPDAQWRTVKNSDEWNARYKKGDNGQPLLPTQEEPMTDEELQSYLHDLDIVDTNVSTAATTGDLQKAVVDLNAVQEQNHLSPTSDLTLKKTTEQLVDKGLKPDEAVKSAIKAETKRTARKIQASTREQERAVPPLTEKEAADVTAKMGGQGFSVITADKLSHSESEDSLDVKPISDIVTDTAFSTYKSTVAQEAFRSWAGNEDTTYKKDFKDYVDLIEKYGSLSKVPLDKAGQYLAERTGAVPWDAAEVKEFVERPHVQQWGRELDQQLVGRQVQNEEPTPLSERIVSPAIQDTNGRVFSGVSHGEAINKSGETSPEFVKSITQGFITNTNRFLDRETAHKEFGIKVAEDIPTEPARAPRTVGRADAPIWLPQEQRDIDTMDRMGLAKGGQGMVDFLSASKDPVFVALGKDLSKFTDSLSRISANVRQLDGGAYTKGSGNNNYEVAISPAILRSAPYVQEYTVAHELIHGLTLAELNNPTNARIAEQLGDLRARVSETLPKNMKAALTTAISENWLNKWQSRQVDFESLMPRGTFAQRDTLYSLLNDREFVSQGLSSKNFREFLQGVKTKGETWYNRFSNLVKSLLGVGEKVPNTAFSEFLSKTDQLLDRGNYVSSFRNFSDRYFENLGMSSNYANSNTQRAMGLMLSDLSLSSPADALATFRFGAGGIRQPEWARSSRDVTRMFNEKGDDAAVTQSVLDETGHRPDATGLLDLADSLMLGEVGPDVLDLLPEPAIKHVLETAKDAQNIFGVIRAATLGGNKGVLNIASPELIHSVAKDTLRGIEKVVAQERMHDQQIRDIQGLFSVPPDGAFSSFVSSPEVLPEWAHGDKKKTWWDAVTRFLEPQGQTAKRIPEAAEAITVGRQLRPNIRHMAMESLKALGMDLGTMQLTPKTVKSMFRTFTNPTLRRAADQWIATNNIEGGETVKVLDVDDPKIQKIVGGLSASDRDIVEDMVNKHSYSTQHMQEQILEKGLQIASTNGGALLQKLGGGKLKDSVDVVRRLLDAFTADRSNPEAARFADADITKVQMELDPDTFLTIARFAKSAAESWSTQRDYFKQNPAWSTAQRFGKLLVEFRKGGKSILQGVDSKKEAEALAEGRPYKLSPNKQYDEDRPPNLGFDASGIATKLRELEQNQRDILRNSGTFSSDQIEEMKRYSPSEQFLTEETYRGGVPNLQPQPRRLTKGAEELPWLRNHVSWIHQTANYWSRQLFRAQARAHLADPEISSNEQLRANLQTHYENMLQPDTAVGRFFQRAAMTWFMGFNPASAMINGTQPFLTHVAEFTQMTGKPLDSYRRVLSGLKEVYASGLGHREWKDPVSEKFMKRFIQDGEADISMFDDQAAGQELLHTNLVNILNGDKPQTLGQKLSTMSGSMSAASMWMFKTVERINAMSAGISAYKYYLESEPNLSPDEAYTKAVQFHHAVNYGGGAAARPVGAFAGRGAFPRTVAMLATAMQSYNLGTTFQIARYIRSGFFRPDGLTPHEVFSARKAAVQMLGTQLAAAGVLGLPFVSGMLAVLNQAFPGLEINRRLRESMNTILGEDGDSGHVLTDISMTGVPSMMGWDLQSRLSMGNTVPGVSEINGFEPQNLLGAPVNLVSNFLKGGYKLVAGDPHAIDSFMPSALKKFEQLLRSGGQVLDYRDRPIFTPTLGEKVGIVLGFQPKRLTDYNVASRIAQQADDNIKTREGQFHQQQAEEVLKGNFGSVRQVLQQRIREDKKYDPVQAVRAISSAAEELTFPRDLRREGTVRASDVRGQLLSTFNLPSTQPSETDRLRFRQNVQQRLGLNTTSPTDLQTAQLVDQLRAQNPTASRSELRQQVSLLLHGRRQRNFSLQSE